MLRGVQGRMGCGVRAELVIARAHGSMMQLIASEKKKQCRALRVPPRSCSHSTAHNAMCCLSGARRHGPVEKSGATTPAKKAYTTLWRRTVLMHSSRDTKVRLYIPGRNRRQSKVSWMYRRKERVKRKRRCAPVCKEVALAPHSLSRNGGGLWPRRGRERHDGSDRRAHESGVDRPARARAQQKQRNTLFFYLENGLFIFS